MQVTSTSYRAYALDLWGFGDTAHNILNYSLEQQATLLDRFLNEMGIGKIALVSPYDEERTNAFCDVLTASGVSVVSSRDWQLPHDVTRMLDQVSLPGRSMLRGPHVAYRLAAAANSPLAEGVVILSTGFETASAIASIEADLGKPCVTGNQAMMWHVLQLAGVTTREIGYGALMELAPS